MIIPVSDLVELRHRRTRTRPIGTDIAPPVIDFERRGLTGHPHLWEREREQLGRDLELVFDLDDQEHVSRDSRVVASELPFGMREYAAVLIDTPRIHHKALMKRQVLKVRP